MARPLSTRDALSWVITVDRQHRLRFPSGIEIRLPWLTGGESKEAWIGLGPFKQLLVFPEPKRGDALQNASKRLGTHPLSKRDIQSPSAAVVRRLGSNWPVTMNYEAVGKRFTLTLPREVRLLNLCPPPTGVVVTFPMGGFLEIWSRDIWAAYVTESDASSFEDSSADLEADWPDD